MAPHPNPTPQHRRDWAGRTPSAPHQPLISPRAWTWLRKNASQPAARAQHEPCAIMPSTRLVTGGSSALSMAMVLCSSAFCSSTWAQGTIILCMHEALDKTTAQKGLLHDVHWRHYERLGEQCDNTRADNQARGIRRGASGEYDAAGAHLDTHHPVHFGVLSVLQPKKGLPTMTDEWEGAKIGRSRRTCMGVHGCTRLE